jgi:8-oxo-dGTP pyrophosphatase MutT (NUDIX family)
MGKDKKEKTGRGRGRNVSAGSLEFPHNLREFSAGGVVLKKTKNSKNQKLEDLWAVRSNVPNEKFPNHYWMLAKGWIDNKSHDEPGPMASGQIRADENSLQTAALREVGEELGVEAKIIKKIGTVSYPFVHPDKGRILKFVTFYLMEYISDLPQGHDVETGEVLWLPYDEAYKKLSFSGEKQMLKKANLLI